MNYNRRLRNHILYYVGNIILSYHIIVIDI